MLLFFKNVHTPVNTSFTSVCYLRLASLIFCFGLNAQQRVAEGAARRSSRSSHSSRARRGGRSGGERVAEVIHAADGSRAQRRDGCGEPR